MAAMTNCDAPTNLTDVDILAAATDVHHAIDAAGQAPWEAKGYTYPRGSCGHAAELLA